jgi:peptidoglycan/xylan/chitin deacetylase (PgdA/CDA1 family)
LRSEVRVLWRSALSIASSGRLSILIFHRVLPHRDPLFPNEPIAPEFDGLLRHIKSRFNVLRLCDAAKRLHDDTLPSRALSITFDDGYADNLSIAAPILSRHGLSATVFISTGYLDGDSMWNDIVIAAFRSTQQTELDLTHLGLGKHVLGSLQHRRAAIQHVIGAIKYLPGGERERRVSQLLEASGVARPTGLMLMPHSVRSLVRLGLDIGAHTVTHPILAKLPPGEAWQEIVESKRRLKELVGDRVELFAYPNGKPDDDYGADHVRMVRDAGFSAAVSTAWGAASRASDVFQLPRFMPWTRNPLKFDLLMLRNLRQGPKRQAP